MTCEACGKALGDEAFTVTVGVTDGTTGFPRVIEAPVCDEICGKAYMLRVKDTLMLDKLRIDKVS